MGVQRYTLDKQFECFPINAAGYLGGHQGEAPENAAQRRGADLFSRKSERGVEFAPPLAVIFEVNRPGARLAIHLENHSERGREFDATLALAAEEISPAALRRVLWRFPLMTAKVAGGIYWEALKLFIKRVPLYPHPGRTMESGAPS